jgi:hypothetical protein
MRSYQSSNKIEPLQHLQVSRTLQRAQFPPLIASRQSNRQDAQASHTSPSFSPSKRQPTFSGPRALKSLRRSFFLIPAAAHHSSLVRNLAPIKNPIIIRAATPGANFFAPPCFPRLQRAKDTHTHSLITKRARNGNQPRGRATRKIRSDEKMALLTCCLTSIKNGSLERRACVSVSISTVFPLHLTTNNNINPFSPAHCR